MTLGEFDIIEHFFKKQPIMRDDVILGPGDDCALVEIPPNQQLAITMDTLVAGVHFPHTTCAYDIGYKSLAVNLSDLAAMGATPAWVTCALTLPHADETWLTDFSRGFFTLAATHNVQLIGGDLTRGPLSITVTAHGFVSKHHAVKRSGAKPGDLIYVTNTLGDAALGLLILNKKISSSPDNEKNVLTHLNRPEPQIDIGKKLLPLAHAMIDISDGLAADLGHLLKASNVGAIIYVDKIPLSPALQQIPAEQAISLALNGGDDYELCFTLPKEKQNQLKNLSQLTCIGEITAAQTFNLYYQDGKKYYTPTHGYQHFSG